MKTKWKYFTENDLKYLDPGSCMHYSAECTSIEKAKRKKSTAEADIKESGEW